jgi:hypothetical protein
MISIFAILPLLFDFRILLTENGAATRHKDTFFGKEYSQFVGDDPEYTARKAKLKKQKAVAEKLCYGKTIGIIRNLPNATRHTSEVSELRPRQS